MYHIVTYCDYLEGTPTIHKPWCRSSSRSGAANQTHQSVRIKSHQLLGRPPAIGFPMGFPHGIDGDIMGDEWDILINHNMILGILGVSENGRKMPKILMNDNFQKEKCRKMVMNQWFQGSMPCRKPNRKWEQLVWSSHLAVSAPWNGKKTFSVVKKSTLRQLMLHVESIWVATP